ncbi:PP2C family protein-serine/threonine phosphatase [Clostridium thailandense]|uniref:PP2C family protein-serine/threonine phosphatase n=1 Tax=Clostridium thailandense TaxID=2794346 RepID=UPI003988C819
MKKSLLFLIIIVLLFYIRHILRNKSREKYIAIGNEQIIGKREEQEDSFSTIVSEKGMMAVLADGIGGYSKGKIASSIVVNTFVHEFLKSPDLAHMENFFKSTAKKANKEILEKIKGVKSGSTVAVVIIYENYLYWASVGDSAIALFRKGEFINLNKKHIFEFLLQEQYLSGKISKEAILKNPMKKRLTDYIGHDEFKEIEINKYPIELKQGDKIILCSDGVYNSISEFEMEKVLEKNVEAFKASEEIIDIINKKNYPKQDNATIIILKNED